jgi:hypothetical protein
MIWLTVTPTGVSQQVKISFEIPAGSTAQLYYTADNPARMATWTIHPTIFTASGDALIDGLTDSQQYLFMLVVDTGLAVALSSMLRAMPYRAALTYDVQVRRDVINVYPTDLIPSVAYRLKIQAYGAVNMPNEIFLYQQERDPITGLPVDAFVTVCTAADLEQFPVGTTTLGEPPFYRLADVDVVEPTLERVGLFWESVLAAVTELKAGLETSSRRAVQNLISFESGTAPVGSSSSSM